MKIVNCHSKITLISSTTLHDKFISRLKLTKNLDDMTIEAASHDNKRVDNTR